MADTTSYFAQVSFQFCGHLDEYLVKRAKHVALMYCQTRFGSGGHTLRIYEDGKLIEEKHLGSSRKLFGYYFLMWRHWRRELREFSKDKKSVRVIFSHPILNLGIGRKANIHRTFWQWDYFPSGKFVDRLFNLASFRAAKSVERYLPLTKSIAEAMSMPNVRPLMLGMKKLDCAEVDRSSSRRLLLVGQLRPGQGVLEAVRFVGSNHEYSLSLLGAPANGFGDEIRSVIRECGCEDRVYFPARFLSEDEVAAEAEKCFCGLAFYSTAGNNFTHFADPGKVKSYLEMGLPVVMTRISAIVEYVERFHAGVVMDSLDDIGLALCTIVKNYSTYREGCRAFAEHFDVFRYYNDVL